ncbi:DUF721 domain-containing protein [uncultured Maricaulis sp.]|uniref:DUF721 domain-containing protein n=1 Tax=uncultured Maricaulis sp. TaxID=174710 RepID=UPI0030D949E1|tara:strand:- start:57623 stop:58156 length:534 start_codon:yes stop_codon:yes gene_type:complete
MVSKPPSSTLERQARRFLESHRGRRAIRAAPPAGRAAERILKPLAKRFGVGVERLVEHWPEIVGARLAEWCMPEAIQNSAGNKVLVIRARGPAAAVLQAESRRILERVRLFAGDRAPTRLRVLQGATRAPLPAARPTAKPPAAPQVSERVEESLEARLLSALDRYGNSVKGRNGTDL